MRRLLATLLVSASISIVSAQDVLVGDMNGDNELTISDVTELVDAVMGKSEKRYIYSAEEFLRENAVTGTYKINGVEKTFVDGYEYVDLGLSVKWAAFNVGASSPEEYGDYYAWGEVEPKTNYTWATYKWVQDNQNSWKYINKYTFPDKQTTGIWYKNGTFVGDNIAELEPEDDVVQTKWKGKWHIPSKEDAEELLTKCTWTWTGNYKDTKIAGYIVTSNVPGYTDKSIFLPAAGFYYGNSLNAETNTGYYWLKELGNIYVDYAYFIDFYAKEKFTSRSIRYYGQSIRAVNK